MRLPANYEIAEIRSSGFALTHVASHVINTWLDTQFSEAFLFTYRMIHAARTKSQIEPIQHTCCSTRCTTTCSWSCLIVLCLLTIHALPSTQPTDAISHNLQARAAASTAGYSLIAPGARLFAIPHHSLSGGCGRLVVPARLRDLRRFQCCCQLLHLPVKGTAMRADLPQICDIATLHTMAGPEPKVGNRRAQVQQSPQLYTQPA